MVVITQQRLLVPQPTYSVIIHKFSGHRGYRVNRIIVADPMINMRQCHGQNKSQYDALKYYTSRVVNGNLTQVLMVFHLSDKVRLTPEIHQSEIPSS